MVETQQNLQAKPRPVSARIEALDALRGLGCLGVLFYHYTTRYDQIYGHPAPLPLSIPAGRYGVLLFFMISGFVILMSLERTPTILEFAVKRLARLYPAYWAAIALTFLAVATFGLPGREVTLSVALLNGLMFHPLLRVPNVDGVYWTLMVELIFYVLMAGLYLLRALPKVEWAMALWLLVNTLENFNLLIEVPEVAERWLILPYAHLFVMGIVFYRLRQQGSSWLRYGLLAASLAYHLSVAPEPDKLVTVLLFMGAFFLINAGRLEAIAVPPLLWLGAISYPLYLLHQNIGYIVIRALEGWGVLPAVSVVVATGVAIALAAVVTAMVERPGGQWVVGVYKRIR